ncbi:MAG: hypothetical protein HZB56_02535 [Deltaproteobacteria bacterium]|nr:hypothetical protein [Deltaproteobacteria bacterium]
MLRALRWLALLWALAPQARAAEVPRGREVIEVDHVPGKLGAVIFRHADHGRRKRPDGTLIRCRDCHHTLAGDEPTSAAQLQAMRCTLCHVGLGEAPRVIGGKAARPVAALKPDGAIDHRSILFHDYCRGCHQAQRGGERLLAACKVCHEKGIGSGVLHGRYDAERQPGTALSWLRCAAGQRWTGKRCDGAAAAVSWAEAPGHCPEGYRLPAPAELHGLLGCAEGGRGCRPCAQSPACAPLLGADAGSYWTSAEQGEKAQVVRLADGAASLQPKGGAAAVRCLQEVRP